MIALVVVSAIFCVMGFIWLCVWLANSESQANIQREKNEEEKWAQ